VRNRVTIGNAQGFWGDLPSAAVDLLSQIPELDYLTMDYLAEVSMSILAIQRQRDPQLGYPRDFVQVVRDLAAYWNSGGKCRLIANAGGLNPMGCALACRQVLEEQGCRSLKIGVVSGDDILSILAQPSGDVASFRNLDDSRPLSSVQDRLVTANAYMGCQGMVDALRAGADIVITGRVADPSMVLAACVHAFDWPLNDWNRIAQGTIAGHLIECGTQVTGGISTDWLSVPSPEAIGFPTLEIDSDGTCIVTKPEGTGGRVTEETVKEQLLYEIGDPGRYLSPDVEVSFLDLRVAQRGRDRVEVTGALGAPPPKTLKVSATYRDGFRAAGTLSIFGLQAEDKARRAGQIVLDRLRSAGWDYRDSIVECLGSADSVPLPTGARGSGARESSDSLETVLRLAVESESRNAVEAFSQSLMSLVTAGPQGTTGYAEGRPRVHSVFRYWPCLIDAERVAATLDFIQTADLLDSAPPAAWMPRPRSVANAASEVPSLDSQPSLTGRLIDIAYGRSGDKGTGANVGILVRTASDYDAMVDWLTVQRVRSYFQELGVTTVQRFELPNLGGLNFVLGGVLQRGCRNDAQGKALAQALLAMPLEDWPIASRSDKNGDRVQII
jgi:hypothetical protein